MSVRLALRTEAEKVSELIKKGSEEGLLLERKIVEINSLISKNRVFVAVEGKELVGVAVLDFYSERLSELRSVFVLPEFRNKSIGKKLIDFAFSKARFLGVSELFVITNPKAAGWFLKQGFGERPKNLKIVLFKKT